MTSVAHGGLWDASSSMPSVPMTVGSGATPNHSSCRHSRPASHSASGTPASAAATITYAARCCSDRWTPKRSLPRTVPTHASTSASATNAIAKYCAAQLIVA